MATVELIVCAKDRHIGIWEKGYISSYQEYPPGRSWMGRDGRPNKVYISVANATLNDVSSYIAQWHKNYKAEITNVLATTNEIRITVDPDSVSTKGVGNGVEQQVKDTIVSTFSAEVVDSQANLFDVEIDKATPLKDVEEHLHDVGDKPFRTRRMRVKESVVDTLNASETGQVEMTLTELENSVDSILDD